MFFRRVVYSFFAVSFLSTCCHMLFYAQVLGLGIDMYEVSFLSDAPPASSSNSAFTMRESACYHRGYDIDVVHTSACTGTCARHGSIEYFVLLVVFNYRIVGCSMVLERIQNENDIYPTLGRCAGSIFNGLG